jgi:hypothetical protein
MKVEPDVLSDILAGKVLLPKNLSWDLITPEQVEATLFFLEQDIRDLAENVSDILQGGKKGGLAKIVVKLEKVADKLSTLQMN